jgi:hypothetical protein
MKSDWIEMNFEMRLNWFEMRLIWNEIKWLEIEWDWTKWWNWIEVDLNQIEMKLIWNDEMECRCLFEWVLLELDSNEMIEMVPNDEIEWDRIEDERGWGWKRLRMKEVEDGMGWIKRMDEMRSWWWDERKWMRESGDTAPVGVRVSRWLSGWNQGRACDSWWNQGTPAFCFF